LSAFVAGDLDGVVVHGHGLDFELEVAIELLPDVAPDGELHELGHAGRAIQEEDALDERLGVLHFVDRFFLDVIREVAVVPVLAHLGMQEVLVDRGQFFLERLVQQGDDFRVAFHGSNSNRCPICRPGVMQASCSLKRLHNYCNDASICS